MPWSIDGTDITELTREEATWNTLTLEFQVPASLYDSTLADVELNAGKVGAFTTAKGDFTASDTAGGGNSYTLSPPTERNDLRRDGLTWHCKKFSKEQLDKGGNHYNVLTVWHPEESKSLAQTYPLETPSYPSGYGVDYGTDYGTSGGGGDWLFIYRRGRVATRRVNANITSKTKDEITGATVRVVMDTSQATTHEEHCSRQDSVHERKYPDGDNEVEDASPLKRNSIYIRPPSASSSIPEGYYRVSEWTTSWVNGPYHEVQMTLAETDTADTTTYTFGTVEAGFTS